MKLTLNVFIFITLLAADSTLISGARFSLPSSRDRTIIVGGGVSGLSAALLLHKHGKEVIVLEADDRVGGRVYSPRDPHFGYTDVGAAYIGPTQDHLLRMIQELKLEKNLYNVYDEGNDVYFLNDRRYVSHGDHVPTFEDADVQRDVSGFFDLLDRIGETIPAKEPWTAPNATVLDRITFADFIEESCKTEECRAIAAWHVRGNLVCEPYETSALFVLWYTKQAGRSKGINAVRGGAQQAKLQGGMQQIPDGIVKKLGRSRIRLGCVVVAVTQTSSEVTALCEDGTKFWGKHLIVAMAPPMIAGIHFTPNLGALRNQLYQRMMMGSVWKLEAFYKTTFWKNLKFSGSLQSADWEDDFISFSYDDTKPNGSYPAIIGFVAGRTARQALGLTKAQRKQRFINIMNKAFNTTLASEIEYFLEHTMMDNPFTKGCYTAVPHIGTMTDFNNTIREPVGRIYFAGTETAWQWSGYVSGAIQAGERAAKEILFKEKKITLERLNEAEPPNNLL